MQNVHQTVENIKSQIEKTDLFNSFKEVNVRLIDDRLLSIDIVGTDESVYRSADRLERLKDFSLSKDVTTTITTYSAAIKIKEALKNFIDCSKSEIEIHYKYSAVEIKTETGSYSIEVYVSDDEEILVDIACEDSETDDIVRSVRSYYTERAVKIEEIEDVIKLIESKKGN